MCFEARCVPLSPSTKCKCFIMLYHLCLCPAHCLTRVVTYDVLHAARYGMPRPPNIAKQYWRLAGLPIDLMAGTQDGIIPPVNVRRHYDAMRAAGLEVRACGAVCVLECSLGDRALVSCTTEITATKHILTYLLCWCVVIIMQRVLYELTSD